MREDFQIVVEDLGKQFTLPTGSFVALDRISFRVREEARSARIGLNDCHLAFRSPAV